MNLKPYPVQSLDESAYLIQGYNVIRSSGDIARVIVYIKEDLQYKILSSLNNDIAAIWLEVGKYRSKWTVCQYYREHRVLGVQGSESLDSQTRRFETFLSTIETREANNTIIMGDFNIDLRDDNYSQNDFKDKLLTGSKGLY